MTPEIERLTAVVTDLQKAKILALSTWKRLDGASPDYLRDDREGGGLVRHAHHAALP
jgi:hypothetical protein